MDIAVEEEEMLIVIAGMDLCHMSYVTWLI